MTDLLHRASAISALSLRLKPSCAMSPPARTPSHNARGPRRRYTRQSPNSKNSLSRQHGQQSSYSIVPLPARPPPARKPGPSVSMTLHRHRDFHRTILHMSQLLLHSSQFLSAQLDTSHFDPIKFRCTWTRLIQLYKVARKRHKRCYANQWIHEHGPSPHCACPHHRQTSGQLGNERGEKGKGIKI